MATMVANTSVPSVKVAIGMQTVVLHRPQGNTHRITKGTRQKAAVRVRKYSIGPDVTDSNPAKQTTLLQAHARLESVAEFLVRLCPLIRPYCVSMQRT